MSNKDVDDTLKRNGFPPLPTLGHEEMDMYDKFIVDYLEERIGNGTTMTISHGELSFTFLKNNPKKAQPKKKK
jgi:hypothetical protein